MAEIEDPWSKCWAWDIETLSNCFTAVFVNMANPNNVRRFLIHEDVNEGPEFCQFYRSCKGLIGFNSIGFDNPVVHTQLLSREQFIAKMSGYQLAQQIYDYAQSLINADFPPRIKSIVPQHDCYLIHHFDNDAKSTSLKWVQVAIKWHNVEDMPISHTTHVTKDMIPTIMDYNLNDSLSTRQFYLMKCLEKVKIRKVLSRKYNLDFSNHNDPKIGEEIILSMVAKKMGIDFWDIRKMRTHRQSIELKDIILPEISFKSNEFKRIYDTFYHMDINPQFTRKKDNYSVIFDGMTYEFGLGGLHAARPNRSFQNVDSVDVSSFYPNLSIENGFYVEHLGVYFLEVYKDIFIERKLYKKKSPENEGLKLSLNGSFGKTNSQYSGLYDPKVTMQITINGQLLLAMLCEELTLSGAAKVIMANTDGIECLVFDREKFLLICKTWELRTRLVLEYAQYTTLAIRDVNNYIGVLPDGRTKEKGAYEVEKDINKDQSMPIVAHAVREFFKNGTSVVKTINECEDIWQFFMAVRAKTGELALRYIDPWTEEMVTVKAPKTLRYYISRKGDVLLKKSDRKEGRVHQGVYITEMNKFVDKPFAQYDVNKRFYIMEAEKLLVGVTKGQIESLF